MEISVKMRNSFYSLVENDKDTLFDLKSLEKNPENFNLWITLGKKLFDLKKYEPALECFNNASKLNPNSAIVAQYKGQALLTICSNIQKLWRHLTNP